MKKDDLKKMLAHEVEEWAKKSFEELQQMTDPVIYDSGEGDKTCQVEIQVLEKTKEYVQLSLSVADGSLSRYIMPLSRSLIVHKDGGVDK